MCCCWVCGHDLSRAQFDSMRELDVREIQSQYQEILGLQRIIEKQTKDMELLKEQKDAEIDELKDNIDRLENLTAKFVRRSTC